MKRKIVDVYAILTLAILMLMAIIPNASAQEEIWFGGIICTIYIVIFIVWLMVAIWVYRDAESRNQSGVLWLLVVLVGGIVGLIIYFVVRSSWSNMPPPMMAPYGYPPPAYPCRTCGSPLMFVPQQNRWYCPRCQRYL